jgi:hypothetical protein
VLSYLCGHKRLSGGVDTLFEALYVDEVASGSIAANAGLEPGDMILSMNKCRCGTLLNFGFVQSLVLFVLNRIWYQRMVCFVTLRTHKLTHRQACNLLEQFCEGMLLQSSA